MSGHAETANHAMRRDASQKVSLFVLPLLLAGISVGDGVRIVHPAHGQAIEYIPDIPLWVRLEKGAGECFDLLIDGKSAEITCEEDTVLSLMPALGPHTIEAVPTFMPSSHGPRASAEFSVHIDPDSSNVIPSWLASADGMHIEQPPEVEDYHKWWYRSGTWVRTYWRGVVCHKSPADQWNYQEILHELKPALILELGTRFGGSALFFSDVMRTVHRAGTPYRILTVDIFRSDIDKQVFVEPHVEVLTAPSASARMANRVRELRQQLPGPMFVIHDADHGMDNVTLELQMVAPLLQKGDYVIVEDTNLDGHEHAVAPGWGPSPYDAIVQFMAMNRGLFDRDLEREKKWGFSQAMNGFLRVKGGGGEIVNPLKVNPYLDQ
jgi:cephalosporin hydroxylase